MTIDEFCDRHNACEEGKDWAVENCKTMQDVWETAKPEWLIWVATRPGVLTDKELRLFAVWCARQVWHLLFDDRSRNAVEVAERYANGEATAKELEAARNAAWPAVADSSDAAWAAWASASDAASDAQAEWLRANTKPNFKVLAGEEE